MNKCQLLWNLSYSQYGICSNTQTHALVGYSERVLKKFCGLVIQFCHSSERKCQRHDKICENLLKLMISPFICSIFTFSWVFSCPTVLLYQSQQQTRVWQKQTGLLNMNHVFGSYIQFDINRPEREELCCICLEISKFRLLPLKEFYIFCYR